VSAEAPFNRYVQGLNTVRHRQIDGARQPKLLFGYSELSNVFVTSNGNAVVVEQWLQSALPRRLDVNRECDPKRAAGHPQQRRQLRIIALAQCAIQHPWVMPASGATSLIPRARPTTPSAWAT